jgi:hypothetical protein
MRSERVLAGVAIGAGILLGLLGGAALLGRAIEQSRPPERYVTVRGLAERDVTADLAVWPIKVRAAGVNLGDTSRSADAARGKVLAFLAENGIAASELVDQSVRVLDREANEYGQPGPGLRYMVEHTIVVRSADVGKVRKVSHMTDKLVAAGVVLAASGGWDRGTPRFLFTQLNAIKPAMMAEATRAAREAANQFAADSGSRVGPIRKATQGLFTISDRDQAASGDGDGGGMAASEPNKRVRVVVTIDYLLEK